MPTYQSQVRRQLAGQLAAGLVPSTAQEAAVTGSVAKGWADQHSDLEVALWTRQLGTSTDYDEALRALGAERVGPSETSGGAVATKTRLDGILVEATWQHLDALSQQLAPVLAGVEQDQEAHVWAWHVAAAVPLVDSPVLALWQQRLRDYPPELAEILTEGVAERWAQADGLPTSLATISHLVDRGAAIALNARLHIEMLGVLRVVAATNRRFECDVKWLAQAAASYDVRPDRLLERAQHAVTARDLAVRVIAFADLAVDCLALGPDVPSGRQAREQLGQLRVRHGGSSC